MEKKEGKNPTKQTKPKQKQEKEKTKNNNKVEEKTTIKEKETNEEKAIVKTKNDKKEIKGNYLLGILGGILGGLIGTIPWMLMYIYGNMMLSILAVVIAAGAFYGYKLFNGKVTKVLPAIIMIVSILIVALTTFVFIPAFYLHNEGLMVSFDSMKELYTNGEFFEGISKDAVIAVFFTILGASIITGNIRRKIANGDTEDIDLSNSKEIEKIKKDAIDKIKPIFEKFNSFEKEHGVLKEELNAEVNENIELKVALNQLKSFGIVKKSKGRFYYSKEAEEKQIQPKKKLNSKAVTIIIAVLLVATMFAVIFYNEAKNNETINVADEVVSFDIASNWEKFTSPYDTGWNYYRYINTTPPLNGEEIAEDDYDKYPAYINISYYQVDTEELPDIVAVQNSMKEYITSLENTPETYEEKIEKTDKELEILKLRMIFKRDPEQIEYAYYILNNNTLVCIDGYSFNLKDDKELEKTVEKISNSFEWK